jgi:predicted MFS family arabinose efflux permease
MEGLKCLDDREWRRALDFCDRSRLTLPLRETVRDILPRWVRERLDECAAKNRERLARTEQTYRELVQCIGATGADFLALKGITHCALFGGRPELRVQYDIDLFAPHEHISTARDALRGIGYEPFEAMEAFPTDHLPVMVRKTGWEWRGDYFDIDIPLSVDLHFQFWNEAVERLRAPGMEEFWNRRTTRSIGGIELNVLHPADALGYSALHMLRHLLRGSVSPFHVYEIAGLLEGLAGNGGFWQQWRALHAPGLRHLEAVAFRLAVEWFGCRVAAEVEEENAQLSTAVEAWFGQFATSPATAPYSPNKDELWLHCALVESRRDQWSVVRRRLAPLNLPPSCAAVFVADEQLTWRKRLRSRMKWAGYTAGRVRHHAVALPRVAASGARWWWRANSLGGEFWRFLTASVLFNFALFIFVLLYNLYLVDLGFREDVLGLVNGANRVGSLAGTLPAAFVAYRLGLRKTLLVTIASTAAIELLRALLVTPATAAALGFASGFVFALWAVIFAPLIVSAVTEKQRAAAFSLFAAVMIGVGVAGNWIGGQLPTWFDGKQPVLVFSAVLSAAALWPAVRLRVSPRTGGEARGFRRSFPHSRFLVRFLVAYAVWQLATGVFNPFANVYFARLHFSVGLIGSLFSASQVAQVAALTMAPFVFRRCGLAGGISWMMLATALGLLGLAAQPPGIAPALMFGAYMSFQWMSEPGLNTLLMGQVREEERSGASALNYLIAFGAQALAAFAGGATMARIGYGAALAGAAALAVGAAGLFRALAIRRETAPQFPALEAAGAQNIPE